MAGILDNKSRVMDVIVTELGRRQLASGKMRIEFASFTDSTTFYRPDISSGSADATKRLYFEAVSQHQDMITFETDDSGQLLGFDVDSQTSIVGDSIFDKSSTGADLSDFLFVTGTAPFASVAQGIISSSQDHFKDLYMLGSRNSFTRDKSLDLSTSKIDFTMDNERPIPTSETSDTTIDAIDSFFLDPYLDHLPQFQFLPPEIPSDAVSVFLDADKDALYELAANDNSVITAEDVDIFLAQGNKLGVYANYGNPAPTYEELMTGLEGGDVSVIDTYAATGQSYEPTPKERHDIEFNSTSEENNIIMQIFEVGNSRFTKLDVIDFGEFSIAGEPFPGFRSNKHVFFIGKVIFDSIRMPTFVNIFTMVID